MIWQDAVFSLGGAFFSLALIPMLRDERTEVPRATSVPTACFLFAFVLTHLSLGLHWAACTEAIACLMWLAVALWRGPMRRAGKLLQFHSWAKPPSFRR